MRVIIHPAGLIHADDKGFLRPDCGLSCGTILRLEHCSRDDRTSLSRLNILVFRIFMDKDESQIGDVNNPPKGSTGHENAESGITGERHVRLRTRIKTSWRRTSYWNILLVCLTAVIAFSNGCYGCYARKQFLVMDGQLQQMQGSSKQTDQMLCLIRQQLKELHNQATDTHALAGAAVQSATDADQTLTNNSAQFRIEERPYVSFENIRFDPALDQAHLPARIKFDWHNAGHTPALRGTFDMDIFVDNTRTAQLPRDFPAEITIPSGEASTGSVSVWIRGSGDFDGITNGTRKLSIKGKFVYTDIFKEWHPTSFCAVYDGPHKQWVFCPGNKVR
jgi:hypothetical protein